MTNKYLINEILDKIRNASENKIGLELSIDETKVLADRIGDLRLIPVYTMEQIAQLCDEGKLGQQVFPSKTDN
ncbi:MAG: hypothetical protein WB445_06305 [Acinetobacter sp.]